MRILLLAVALQSVACVTVAVDVEEVCSESALAFEAPALSATAKVDFKLLPDTKLSWVRTTLELDARMVDDLTVAVDGVSSTFRLTDVERESGVIDLTERLQLEEQLEKGAVGLTYRVTPRAGVARIKATARTCASSSTRIERRVY